MKNDGNYVASLSQLGRWLAEQAEEGGRDDPARDRGRRSCSSSDGRVVGVRTGDKGRGRDGEPLPNFEPGSDLVARVTVLAEGTQGHLTGAAIERFGLAGDNPQVWALGVKEVWKVAKPLDRVIHTMGWPLRGGREYREFGGSFIYPMGEDMVTLGMVVGLDYRDAELSVHDLLQELKTHPLVRKILEGGERVEWGAKTIPEGGFLALPKQLHAPGLLLCGDGAGLVNVPALKGIHYAIESGRLAAEAAFAALQRGRTAATPGALASYDEPCATASSGSDLRAGAEHAARVRPRLLARRRARRRDDRDAAASFPPRTFRTERDAERADRTDRAKRYPAPDGKLTFDKLSSVFASGNRTRDDQPNHIRIQRQGAAGARRALGAHVPGAGVRGRRRGRRRDGRGRGERRRTACSAARSPPRAAGSRRPRAARAPSTS